jgi:hypothetical protein
MTTRELGRFTITVYENRTSVRSQCAKGGNPERVLALAIEALEGQQAVVGNCPAQKARDNALWQLYRSSSCYGPDNRHEQRLYRQLVDEGLAELSQGLDRNYPDRGWYVLTPAGETLVERHVAARVLANATSGDGSEAAPTKPQSGQRP